MVGPGILLSGQLIAASGTGKKTLSAEWSQAAAEISEISDSSVEIAETAGGAIEGIVPSIRQVAKLVQEIAVASREQDAGDLDEDKGCGTVVNFEAQKQRDVRVPEYDRY